MNTAATIHVSPDGAHEAPGHETHPTTLAGALRRCAEAPEAPPEVVLAGGLYPLAEPLRFTGAHGGRPGHPLRWRAAEGARPVISGAAPVTGWRRLDHEVPGASEAAAANLWCAEVGAADFRTLYEGERMLERARIGPLSSDPARHGEATATKLCARPEDLGDWARPEAIDLFISPTHLWQAEYLPVASIDREAALITTKLPGTYALASNPDRSPPIMYWLENVAEGLTGPGTWMLDRARGTLYLWPASGGEPADIRMPLLTELVRLEGETGAPCMHIELEGITFTQGDWIHWPENRRAAQHDWQVHDWPDAMVALKNAQSLTLRDCRFTDAGATGLRMDGMAAHNTVERCDFARLGGSAVAILGSEPGGADHSHHNRIVANHVHHVGTHWWQASGIFIHQSGHNEIADNHLHDLPYTAITLVSGREGAFGEAPGNHGRNGALVSEEAFGESPFEWPYTIGHLACRHNRVAFNDVHDVMQRIGDGNGIYLSGTGWGNIVEGNFVHDISGAGVHSAIRTDDMQWYTRLERNLICRCHGAGITLKHVNDITDNVIVDTMRMGALIVRRGPSWGANIKRNIILLHAIPEWLNTPPGPFFADGGKMGGDFAQTHFDDNLVWSPADPAHAEASQAAMQARGVQARGLAADPCFVDPEHDDYRLAAGSPALALGIRSLEHWGVRGPCGAGGDRDAGCRSS